MNMVNKSSTLSDAFDESVQIKIQFIRKDGKLKMVRRKIRNQKFLKPKKQLFPISKERK